mgnify:CR=1 FL=1
MQQLKDCLEIITMAWFLIFMFKQLVIPSFKEVKSKEEKPKKKRILKYFRRFHIPYRGKTIMYKYDKKYGYINSAWEEVEKPKRSKK